MAVANAVNASTTLHNMLLSVDPNTVIELVFAAVRTRWRLPRPVWILRCAAGILRTPLTTICASWLAHFNEAYAAKTTNTSCYLWTNLRLLLSIRILMSLTVVIIPSPSTTKLQKLNGRTLNGCKCTQKPSTPSTYTSPTAQTKPKLTKVTKLLVIQGTLRFSPFRSFS